MERLRKIFRFDTENEEQSYERLAGSETLAARDASSASTSPLNVPHNGSTNSIDKSRATRYRDGHASADMHRFSSLEYAIFVLLGVSMLWAWNMFLAAGPYFAHRFRGSRWLTANFQSAEIAISTATNFITVLVLTRRHAAAHYPRRIVASLVLNLVVFALLAASTAVHVPANIYFGFLLVMIFLASLAAGCCQNGLFAFVAGFGQPRYTQGIMTGQALAGVLPCVAQIVSVLSLTSADDGDDDGNGQIPDGPPPVRWTAALAYFSTAAVISVVTLVAFFQLLVRQQAAQRRLLARPVEIGNGDDEDELGHDDDEAIRSADHGDSADKDISMWYLCHKLSWFVAAIFITFGVTMVYPVFTQQILSTRPLDEQGRLFQPASFVPLAFLFWNSGDLIGRVITAVPSLSLVRWPRTVFVLALCRVVYASTYQLCNIRGQGAVVSSDFFYLVMVQLLFGISNGYIGSVCMIAAAEWVEPEEREAAGGFMGMALIGGLTAGSLASFAVANI